MNEMTNQPAFAPPTIPAPPTRRSRRGLVIAGSAVGLALAVIAVATRSGDAPAAIAATTTEAKPTTSAPTTTEPATTTTAAPDCVDGDEQRRHVLSNHDYDIYRCVDGKWRFDQKVSPPTTTVAPTTTLPPTTLPPETVPPTLPPETVPATLPPVAVDKCAAAANETILTLSTLLDLADSDPDSLTDNPEVLAVVGGMSDVIIDGCGVARMGEGVSMLIMYFDSQMGARGPYANAFTEGFLGKLCSLPDEVPITFTSQASLVCATL